MYAKWDPPVKDTSSAHEKLLIINKFNSFWTRRFGIRVRVRYENFDDKEYTASARLHLCSNGVNINLITYYREHYMANFDGTVVRGWPPVTWYFLPPSKKQILCQYLLRTLRLLMKKP